MFEVELKVTFGFLWRVFTPAKFRTEVLLLKRPLVQVTCCCYVLLSNNVHFSRSQLILLRSVETETVTPSCHVLPLVRDAFRST